MVAVVGASVVVGATVVAAAAAATVAVAVAVADADEKVTTVNPVEEEEEAGTLQ